MSRGWGRLERTIATPMSIARLASCAASSNRLIIILTVALLR
jgi:hypothetical protein